MPERPDLRQIAAAVRESLDGLERDALVDILTYVLNEYVVEGPPPLAAAQVERLEDLAGLDLAGLVGALQTRLDVPGLELLRVEGAEVRVHTAQGWVPLQPQRGARDDRQGPDGRAGARFVEQPIVRPAPPRPPEPTGRPAADEALARGRGDLIGGERGIITPPAPRPRGVSISGRPTAAPASTPPAPPAQEPPAVAQPPAQPADQSSGERKEDDASIRFSLLELD
ncbi:MAG TPA: hypothetical protein VNO33_06250 [Kofleriaceae bacterium]|nr:hypothetical protein [Kofleriaceae bacterium]